MIPARPQRTGRRQGRDWIDVLIEYGVDRANRRIFLFDDVDNVPIGTVIKALYMLDQESKTKPIHLFVGSYGGVEYDMFALYDAIRVCRAPVHTTAIGKCMSAAPLLVCAGKKGHRSAAPNTFFMVHQGWDDIGVKRYDELKSDMKLFETINQRWCALMAKHTNKTAEFWKEQCEKVGDLYFGAEQAMKWGMVDHVWRVK